MAAPQHPRGSSLCGSPSSGGRGRGPGGELRGVLAGEIRCCVADAAWPMRGGGGLGPVGPTVRPLPPSQPHQGARASSFSQSLARPALRSPRLRGVPPEPARLPPRPAATQELLQPFLMLCGV